MFYIFFVIVLFLYATTTTVVRRAVYIRPRGGFMQLVRERERGADIEIDTGLSLQ